jgi:hypothetical protein
MPKLVIIDPTISRGKTPRSELTVMRVSIKLFADEAERITEAN